MAWALLARTQRLTSRRPSHRRGRRDTRYELLKGGGAKQLGDLLQRILQKCWVLDCKLSRTGRVGGGDGLVKMVGHDVYLLLSTSSARRRG